MYFSASLIGLFLAAVRAEPIDLTQYVLTDTGESNGGNTFAGVSLPFGMVKLGPDMFFGADAYSGDVTIGNFTGFSMMHESGTGGAPKYGVVSQMPVLGNITEPLANLNDTRVRPDITSVGYYKAALGSGITVELGATSRAGYYQYTFPTSNQSNVVVDISHVLPSYRGQGLSQRYLGGEISTSSNHYEGHADYDNGWNRAPLWTIFFCGYFDSGDTPSIVNTFVGQNDNTSQLVDYNTTSTVNSTARLGAVFNFGNATNVTSRVGISFISTAQACDNVNTQIPAGTTLAILTSNAKQVWNDEVLSKVTTTESNLSNLQLLYSSMYFMHLLPSNRTGENPLWTSAEPYYDDTFTTWDLFRCTFALLQIFQPSMYEEYIRSLINIFQNEGYMPDARSSNFNGASQGGSNSDNIMADAYVKGVRGAVNWTAGYEAMQKNAEVTPLNNNDPRDLSSSTKEGRGALPDWLELGYITPKYGRAVTRAVEYSVNDFALSQVAAGLGKSADVTRYLNRSRNWRNHWNPEATSLNFSGFLVPRSIEGYIEQDPLQCGGCYWGDAYYEALPWEYSFNAQHDINTLIALSGGPETFVNRLEMMFTPNITARNAPFNSTIFNPGNEPSFNTPYLYNYVGRQDLSVKRSRFIAKSYYSPTPGGLPGNSDAGAMESWLLWNMLGLYPMVGQTTFLIGSPWFANTSISLGAGKALTMTTTGGSNDSSYYVQSLRVNGKKWTQSWVTWDDIFANGGTMNFVLGPVPANWTTGPSPPSPASEHSQYTNGSTIVQPGTVPMAPSAATLAKEAHRRKIMRDVALGVMGFVLLGLLAMVGWLWWYWTRRAKRATAEQGTDQEKGTTGAGKSPRKIEGLKALLLESRHRLMNLFKKKPCPLLPTKEERLKTADGSIGGDTFVDIEAEPPISEKKELRISVLEAFVDEPEPTEPWTPRGTNRRIHEIANERTEL
ncbi:glycoside hydrolase family 92 protein [Hyaloscypha variabilis]